MVDASQIPGQFFYQPSVLGGGLERWFANQISASGHPACFAGWPLSKPFGSLNGVRCPGICAVGARNAARFVWMCWQRFQRPMPLVGVCNLRTFLRCNSPNPSGSEGRRVERGHSEPSWGVPRSRKERGSSTLRRLAS